MEDRFAGPRILIAGLGNCLLGDDGVGVHAARKLAGNPPAGTVVVEVGTAVLDALHLFEWADIILAIDAMNAGGRPGTVYLLPASGAEEPKAKGSLHELNLISALGLLRKKRRPPVLIVGVEPQVIDFSLDLSPEVRSALPLVMRSVMEAVEFCRRGGVNGSPPSNVP